MLMKTKSSQLAILGFVLALNCSLSPVLFATAPNKSSEERGPLQPVLPSPALGTPKPPAELTNANLCSNQNYYRDLYSDTWVASDALGRKMGLPRNNGDRSCVIS